ncbi:MAG TPA: adenylate/guanylate cyclase domain-containing protein [Acidimicrobiia bacterium]
METTGGRSCGQCGALVSSTTAKFCAECGAPIATAGRAPRQVVDDILADRESAGERKFVTVLFADIKSSTEMASALDPEDWFLVLERFHAAASSSIHAFDGVVAAYAGDGVMALFGAPMAHENHAEQACWAALRLTEQFRSIAAQVASTGGTSLGVRMGLNSGEVVVGRIGDESRIDYTAQGLVVHIAARMEQVADVGEIFLAPSAAALVAERFELVRVGTRALKGIVEPIEVHRLVGPIDPTRAADVRLGARTAAFVGRDRELAKLRIALDETRAGRVRVVGIQAPAGHGKTRLVSECLAEARARGDDVVTVVGDVVRVPGPMWTVAELVRALLDVATDADEETILAALADLAPELDAAAATVLNLLAPSAGAPPIDPDVARRHIYEVLRALVRGRARAATGGLAIAIDDVHAIDRASQLTLAALFTEPVDAPVLVVLTSRPTGALQEILPSDGVLIDLEALDLDETHQLVQRWLLDRDEALEVARLLHERTGGNPFFVEETLRSLVESGQLIGPRGTRRLSARLGELTIPARVQTVIASRIDRVDRDERDLLYAAAVIGVEFDHATLVAVSGLESADTTRLLDGLVAADLVRAVGDNVFAFRHRLTQDVAYETQLRDQRRRCHAAVALALEKQAGSDRRAALVADHYERAGDDAAAATWYSRGGALAARTDPAESLRLWQKVRELTVPIDAESVAAALLCRAEILTQSPRCGMDPAEVLTVIGEARALATDDDHRPLLAFVLLRGWYALSGAGLSGEARAISKEAVSIADTTGIGMLSVGARVADLSNFNAAGSVAQGLAECDEAEAVLVAAGLDTPDSQLRSRVDFCRGSLMVRTGRVDAAIVVLESALARADACDDPQWQVVCRVGLVVALVARRDPVEARRVADEAITIARDVCGVGELGMAIRASGLAALTAGDAAAAIAALEESLATARSAPSLTVEEATLAALADAYLLAGNVPHAKALAQETLAIATSRGNDNFELMALLVLARALVAGPDVDRAAIEAIASRCDHLITINDMIAYRADLDELTAYLTRTNASDTVS